MTKTNAGLDLEWLAAIGLAAGEANTATATSATSLTRAGASWTTDQWKNCVVVAASGVYGNVLSNTATVLTIDRWYNPGTPGGAAGTTPSGTTTYSIMPYAGGAMFMGLTTNATAVAAGDTTLPSEITTAGGGLIRKICTLTHTAGGATGTAVAVFTVNASDTGLPVTIAKMGLSPSLLSGQNQLFQTVLSATAVLSAIGDQLTVTDTITC
jgi:hypothetical protein